jgi:hypothetical protein
LAVFESSCYDPLKFSVVKHVTRRVEEIKNVKILNKKGKLDTLVNKKRRKNKN